MDAHPAGTRPPLRGDIRPPFRVLALAAVLVVLCVGLFLFIAEDVLDGGGLISHDEAVLTWFVTHRTDWLVRAARAVSTIAGFAGLAVLSVVLGVVLWFRGWHSWLIAAPLTALLVGGGASAAAKALFGRARPPVHLHAMEVGPLAFPSSHATDAAACLLAAAFTLALTITTRRAVRVVLVVVAAGVAGLVGLSRLVLAVHWLSDVVAGWALGTAVAVVVVVALWWASARPAGDAAAMPEGEAAPHP